MSCQRSSSCHLTAVHTAQLESEAARNLSGLLILQEAKECKAQQEAEQAAPKLLLRTSAPKAYPSVELAGG